MAAVVAYAQYLGRGVSSEGRFRYTVNAPTNQSLPGYDWPRHSGATFFLAQAASLTHDPALAAACARAAALLRGAALSKCGDLPCVGDEPVVNLGSSALALLAFAEIVDRNIDPSYKAQVVELAHFIRTQQRPDGEFMHEYNRIARRPLDHQGPLLLERSDARPRPCLRHHPRSGRPRCRGSRAPLYRRPRVELLR